MSETTHGDRSRLYLDLLALEREESELSFIRRRLHRQIDAGFGNEATLAQERQTSDERRRLHERIDLLRAQLGVDPAREG